MVSIQLVTNLICVGDSNIEMDAARILGKEFSQSLVKTIKFRENPKPEELIKQQELVTQKLEQIYSNPKNLTIKLEKKESIKKDKKDEKTPKAGHPADYTVGPPSEQGPRPPSPEFSAPPDEKEPRMKSTDD